MRPLARLRLSIVAGAVLAASLVGPSASASTSHAQPASGSTSTARTTFTVTGEVAHPLTLTTSDVRRRWSSRTEEVTFQAAQGTEKHTFTGALLTDVLTTAKPEFDPAAHNDALAFAVSARGTDDYTAVVAWGEIDPAFGNKPVLLAVGQDHKALDRPRLVVPGDVKGGRYVSDVADVSLHRVGA